MVKKFVDIHSHGMNGIDESFINKHIHDAKGRKNHLPLGTGEISISERLSLAREHNCRVVIETKTVEGLKQSVEKLASFK